MLLLIAAAFAVAFWLPDIIPTHFDAQGNITDVASKSTALVLGGIMTGSNAVCALVGTFAEKIIARGLNSGTSNPQTMRYITLGCILVIDAIFAVVLMPMSNGVV